MTQPKKSLGQNFLRDESVIDRIVAALDLMEDETIVEIGPGEGALTKRLIETGAKVVAIEIDRELVPVLQTQLLNNPNFRVIESDVLEIDFATFIDNNKAGKTKLVGNLPYYISTAILQKLSRERALFSKVVLMLQREVAQRVTAKPKNSDRGFLTVIVEAAFEAKLLFDVPPAAFYPQPKVWSSVVSLTPKSKSIADEPQFVKLLSAAFEQKRKTILNNLKRIRPDAEARLNEVAISTNRRAETFTLDEWFALYNSFTKK